MTPTLRSVELNDPPASLRGAGLSVDGDGGATVGGVRLLGGDGGAPGVAALGFAGLPEAAGDLDGIALRTAGDPGETPAHPAGYVALDHVVLRTPDLPRTVAALDALGLPVRRTRDVPLDGRPGQQAFVVAGTAVLEVVGPLDAVGDGPTTCWGLALVVADLDRAAAVLGDRLGGARGAVQPGRRIATLRHESVGGTVPWALMTPRTSTASR